MSFAEAVMAAGSMPSDTARREDKQLFSQNLSKHLAEELAEGLRAAGFSGTRPIRGGPGEKEFQGGLGPKKVDVSYSDARHGLLLAVSIKSINFAPFGKNLKNRFGDLCTEAITLHMRFPYSVVCALFAFPFRCDEDVTPGRPISTFRRAMRLFATISGRLEYTDPGEKFEDVTMMLFRPASGKAKAQVRLFDAKTESEITERAYFQKLLTIYNTRNPHAMVESLIEEETP